VDALAALDPDVVLPAHRTGWRAMHELANRLPGAVTQNGVGPAWSSWPPDISLPFWTNPRHFAYRSASQT
jgi:hypothetical protein